MSEQISILKLKDGSTIVGKVKTSGDIVEIEHPIENNRNLRKLKEHAKKTIENCSRFAHPASAI